jgi:hypothetical protein
VLVSEAELPLIEGETLQDTPPSVVFILFPFALVVVPVPPSVNPLSASQVFLEVTIIFIPALIGINPFPLEQSIYKFPIIQPLSLDDTNSFSMKFTPFPISIIAISILKP